MSGILFCLGIHPILEACVSDLVLGYMDDVTLGGRGEDIVADVKRFRCEGEKIGLRLNSSKSEAITTAATLPDEVAMFKRIHPDSASLLGAPIKAGMALDESLRQRTNDFRRAVGRLRSLPSHDALVLLKSSLCVPKVMHLLRCSPCHQHPALTEFDNTMRDGLSIIANSRISDVQWVQASLPIRHGGLGLRRASQLALSAFLASAASTTALQSLILVNSSTEPSDQTVRQYSMEWASIHSCEPPSDAHAHLQRVWDAPSIEYDKKRVSDAAILDMDKARLLATSGQHSSDWLHAMPISSCGLRLDDETVRVAVGLRLGLELCEVHECPCGATVDTRGTHGLSCRQGAARATRHQQLNDLIYRALRRADVPAAKEPSGLSRSDGKRPDGLTLIPWQQGRCLTWDVTVTDTLAASYSSISSTSSGAVAEAAATRKTAKYTTLVDTYMFVPVAIETLGPLCGEAMSFLRELGRRLSERTEDPRETKFLFQRVSILLQRFNAVAFRASFVEEHPVESEGYPPHDHY